MKLSRIIAFPRRSSAIDDIDKSISSKIQILTIDNRFNAISASDVRERLLNDIDGMSLGPNGTAFELYLSDVDDYLKTGKTYLDHDIEHANVENALKNVRMHMHEKTLNMKEQKLMKIMDVLKDACKDVECKYSIIQEIMNGRHEEW